MSEEKTVSPMGLALRYLKGDQNIGEGPIEVKTRLADFDVVTFTSPSGPAAVPGTPLIGFVAQAFREVESDSDLWEFRVSMGPGPEGVPGQIKLIYVAGADLLLVRAPSKVL